MKGVFSPGAAAAPVARRGAARARRGRRTSSARRRPAAALRQPRGAASDARRTRLGRGLRKPADPALRRGRIVRLLAFGARGSGPGQFNDPCGIAVGSVGTRLRGRHVEWPRAGLRRQGRSGCASGAAASSVHAASRWTPAARSSCGHGERADRALRRPRAPGGRVGARRPGPGKLADPQGLVVAGDGTVYVADNGNGRVAVFDRNGAFLRAFDVAGLEARRPSPSPTSRSTPAGFSGSPCPLAGEVRGYTPEGRLVTTLRRAGPSRRTAIREALRPRAPSEEAPLRRGPRGTVRHRPAAEVRLEKRGPAPGRPRVQEVSRGLRKTRGRRDVRPAGSASRCPFRTWDSRRMRRC